MKDIYSSFIEKDDKLIFCDNYLEVYIPSFYFTSKNAIENGRDIQTFGVFKFKVYSNEDKKDLAMFHSLEIPNMITLCPSSVEKKTMGIIKETEEEDTFYILKFYKNDVFIKNLSIPMDSNNCQKFLNLMNAGKIPPTSPYDSVIDLWFANLDVNNENLGVPSVVMEMTISEIYRDKKDISVPFRFRYGSEKKVNPYDYKTVNLKTITNANSTFTALTFEDIDLALTNSINKTRYKEKETATPIEKTIKY